MAASSVAPARISDHIIPGGIAIVAVALRQIIAGTCSSRRAGNRAGGAADDSTGCSTARPPRQKGTEHAAGDRATHRAGTRIGRRRRRTGRRRIAYRRDGRIGIDHVIREVLRDIGRRTLHPLRVVVPDAADVPPPAVTALVDLMPPTPAFPGHATAIMMSAEIARHDRAACKSRIRSMTTRSAN